MEDSRDRIRRMLMTHRLNRGLSLDAASREIGLSRSILMRAENGDTLSPRSMKRIADFYEFVVTDMWPVVTGREPNGDDLPTRAAA